MGYYIYKHYNSDMEVIYVGLTTNMHDRQSKHKLDSKWKDEINSIEYCNVENKTSMTILELYFINKLNPKYNKRDSRFDDVSWLDNAIENLKFKEYKKSELFNKNLKIKKLKKTGSELLREEAELKTINSNSNAQALTNFLYSLENVHKIYMKHECLLMIELQKSNYNNFCNSPQIAYSGRKYENNIMYLLNYDKDSMTLCSSINMMLDDNVELLRIVNEFSTDIGIEFITSI